MPLVGTAIGALAGGTAYAVSFVAPHPFVVAVAFAATIVLSGAVHVDGFLDASDALFASVSPERRREIMRDPHHGTFAIAAFAVVCTFWLAALWSLAPARLPLASAFAATSARFGVIMLARCVPSGRERPPTGALAVSAAFALALGFAIGPAALVAAACVALAFAAGFWIAPRLGGAITGDVYGFLIVSAEVAVLCVASIVRV